MTRSEVGQKRDRDLPVLRELVAVDRMASNHHANDSCHGRKDKDDGKAVGSLKFLVNTLALPCTGRRGHPPTRFAIRLLYSGL